MTPTPSLPVTESPAPPSAPEAPRAEPKPPQNALRRHAPKLIGSLVITASLLYALSQQDLDLLPPAAAFAEVKPLGVLGCVLTIALANYYRAVRWRFLLRAIVEVPRAVVLRVSWVGFGAILLLPFRLGEFIRPLMLSREARIGAPAATGTIVAERIVDGLFVALMLAGSLLWIPRIDPLPERVIGLSSIKTAVVLGSGVSLVLVFSAALATIAAFYFARAWAERLTLRVCGLISNPLASKLASVASGLADGLHFLRRGGDALGFLWETALYWFFNGVSMWALAWACGIVHVDGSGASLAEAFALMGLLSAAILLPGPPGLLGVFQVGVYCGMSLYYPESVIMQQGAVYVALLYVLQLLWQLLAAAACLISPRSRARLRAAERAASGP